MIDDDARNIFALRLTLKARGFACLSAQDAREGIDLARRHAMDIGIVLMDMMMPGIDGYEAIGLLKENPVTATLPVVAVTAQAMQGDKEKCLAAGAVGYLAKPIDVDEMLQVISKHLK